MSAKLSEINIQKFKLKLKETEKKLMQHTKLKLVNMTKNKKKILSQCNIERNRKGQIKKKELTGGKKGRKFKIKFLPGKRRKRDSCWGRFLPSGAGTS